MFFNVQPKNAIINDFNKELINVYDCIKNDPSKIMKLLDEHFKNYSESAENYYYRIRLQDRNKIKLDDYQKAARTIFLNKTCFNGLYRVNKNGCFNAAWGKRKIVNLYDRENFLNVNEYLKNNKVSILNGDFEDAVKTAKKGDLVYFDPPYDLLNENSFTSYTSDGFGVEEQERLAKLCGELNKKGVKWMVSNHNTFRIKKLYENFKITKVSANRIICCDKTKRNSKNIEVIITNY